MTSETSVGMVRWWQWWVIYDHPTDYPHHFVARRWMPTAEGPNPAGDVRTADSLEALRKPLPLNLSHRLQPDPSDDPCIVEIWI